MENKNCYFVYKSNKNVVVVIAESISEVLSMVDCDAIVKIELVPFDIVCNALG